VRLKTVSRCVAVATCPSGVARACATAAGVGDGSGFDWSAGVTGATGVGRVLLSRGADAGEGFVVSATTGGKAMGVEAGLVSGVPTAGVGRVSGD